MAAMKDNAGSLEFNTLYNAQSSAEEPDDADHVVRNKASRPTRILLNRVSTQIGSMSSDLNKQRLYGALMFLFIAALMGVNFVLQVIAGNLVKDTSVSHGTLVDKTTRSTVRTMPVFDTLPGTTPLNRDSFMRVKTASVMSGTMSIQTDILTALVLPCPDDAPTWRPYCHTDGSVYLAFTASPEIVLFAKESNTLTNTRKMTFHAIPNYPSLPNLLTASTNSLGNPTTTMQTSIANRKLQQSSTSCSGMTSTSDVSIRNIAPSDATIFLANPSSPVTSTGATAANTCTLPRNPQLTSTECILADIFACSDGTPSLDYEIYDFAVFDYDYDYQSNPTSSCLATTDMSVTSSLSGSSEFCPNVFSFEVSPTYVSLIHHDTPIPAAPCPAQYRRDANGQPDENGNFCFAPDWSPGTCEYNWAYSGGDGCATSDCVNFQAAISAYEGGSGRSDTMFTCPSYADMIQAYTDPEGGFWGGSKEDGHTCHCFSPTRNTYQSWSSSAIPSNQLCVSINWRPVVSCTATTGQTYTCTTTSETHPPSQEACDAALDAIGAEVAEDATALCESYQGYINGAGLDLDEFVCRVPSWWDCDCYSLLSIRN
mmetsp:Transcript_1211/g.1419  ORF Transcript_1211/g.1419 Transcript_1211/m.1419 type:complete len:597 (-) Transcript_1211:25-1815(-)|eukprot:CAMPEP_0197866316 /NCGR_PEP_ID=MMETSP1438-20131217/44151_1 /TAXON_ID=1461541 /ORGANISM="Pterosperma sp., Strain CCMP1384" /LENGTH=596 /DNA_ID=CAMNT_0043484875 /DNA_START=92 /DNA_END=1882 /DNA_ORIENTATION=-